MLDAGGCRGGALRPSESRMAWGDRAAHEGSGGGVTRDRRRWRVVAPGGAATSCHAAGGHRSAASLIEAMGRRSWGGRQAGGQAAAGVPAATACRARGSCGRDRRRRCVGHAVAAGGGTVMGSKSSCV